MKSLCIFDSTDIPNLNSLDLDCPFRSWKSRNVTSNLLFSLSLDASLFESCDCFVHDVICSEDELNDVANTTELIIIGHNCLNDITEVSFSRFQDLVTLDVGAYSLKNVETLAIEGLLMNIVIIILTFLIFLSSLLEVIHSHTQV